MFFKICVLKNFENFTGKHLCWSLFLTNFIRDTTTLVFSCEIWKNLKNTFSTEHLQWLLLSKEIEHRCLPVIFAKFLRTPFFIEHLRWLLLSGHFFLAERKYHLFGFDTIQFFFSKQHFPMKLLKKNISCIHLKRKTTA